MAVAAVLFERDLNQVHQVLATKTTPDGVSGLPLRPDVSLPDDRPWERIEPPSR
jgi:hypothetical protein